MEITFGLIITLLAVSIAGKIINDTRGCCYAGPNVTTDNENMVRAANEIHLFDWPSRMHSIPNSRAQLREYWVLFLHILGRFRKDKFSDHMNVTLALIANCVSSILIFFVFSNYLSPIVGFIIALMYITSFWQYQALLVIGHIQLSQMFFLIAVLSLQLTEKVNDDISSIFFFFGGFFTVVSFSSSSSAHKFPPLSLIALMYALRDHLHLLWGGTFHVERASLLLTSFMLFAFTIIFKRPFDSTSSSVRKRYIYITLSLFVIVFGFILIFFDLNRAFLMSLLAYIIGLMLAAIHVLFPLSEFKNNVLRYFRWLKSAWRNHFQAYPDQEKTFGRKLPDDFRGGGLIWNHRFFMRVMPFVYPMFLASVIFVGVHVAIEALESQRVDPLVGFIFLLLVSLLPVIVHEVTEGLKVGKAYIPSLIGFLFMIGKALEILIQVSKGNEIGQIVLWVAIIGVVLAQLITSIYVFYTDILPARMAPNILCNQLKKLNVTDFYTYDNPYNDSFVKTMLYSYPDDFSVKYIECLSEVETGIVVIPNTSSKSEHMESTQYSIINGDFTADELLNKLYETREIEKVAISKIRTRGCSKYFVQESEVTSYRDLILNQVDDYDRWIAHGWILSAESIRYANR